MPLDAIDFEPRPWVPYSGWPFPKTTLDPYYARVQRQLELGPFVYDEAAWGLLGVEPPAFDPARVRTAFWQFDDAYWRFGIGSCRDLVKASNVRILLHAVATRLAARREGTAVDFLEVATPEGRLATVRARTFVLAAGGIDNPRLLLASNDVEPGGLGNRFDLVGRFFMEHPHGRAARIETEAPYRLWKRFHKRSAAGVTFAPVLRPGEALQEKGGLLNTSVALRYQRKPEAGLSLHRVIYDAVKTAGPPTTFRRNLWRFYKRANALRHRALDPFVRRMKLARGKSGIYLVARGEQAPNPESRVRLSSTRDALGVPQADLDWRLSVLDKRSVAGLAAALDEELRRLGLGRRQREPWLDEATRDWPVDPTVSKHAIGGYHHMGTTRMADDPKRGVVDRHGRVHGVANLYVAGSSVFPTSGWANPTFTLLALTLRLADHLRATDRAG